MTDKPQIFRLPGRAVIEITGPEARDFLQRVITVDVADLAPGDCRPGALLTPQGKILVDFLIFAEDDTLRLDVAEDAAAGLAKRLTMFKLRAKAEIMQQSDAVAVWSETAFDGSAADPRLEGVFRGITETAGEAASLDAREIAAGVPVFGRDYAEAEVFPTDVNLDVYGGVGWKKGCFIGQEVVSRMKRRGSIRKRALAVVFDGEAPPAGTSLKAGSSTIGEITSSSGHHAVGIVRLDRLDSAAEPATAEGQAASIDVPDALRPDPAAEKI